MLRDEYEQHVRYDCGVWFKWILSAWFSIRTGTAQVSFINEQRAFWLRCYRFQFSIKSRTFSYTVHLFQYLLKYSCPSHTRTRTHSVIFSTKHPSKLLSKVYNLPTIIIVIAFSDKINKKTAIVFKILQLCASVFAVVYIYIYVSWLAIRFAYFFYIVQHNNN